jgi:hypothetical protein
VNVLGEAQAWAQQTQGALARTRANARSGLLKGAANLADRVLPHAVAQQLRADARASTLAGQRAAGSADAQAEQTRADAHQRSAAIAQESQRQTDELTRSAAGPVSGPLALWP